MKYFHYLPIAFIALACGKPAAEPEAAAPDSTFQEVAQVQTTSYLSLEQYENELHALPIAEASSRAGLQLFADQFKKEDKAANDKALKIYLTYQSRLIEKLNEKFHAHPNFEQISSYIWGDSSAVNKD